MLNTELCKGLEDFPSLFSLAVHLVLVLMCYHACCSVGTERSQRVARNTPWADEAISNTPAPCSSASQGSAWLVVSKAEFPHPPGILVLKTQKLILAALKPMGTARALHLWESSPHPFCFECRIDPKWETFCILETKKELKQTSSYLAKTELLLMETKHGKFWSERIMFVKVMTSLNRKFYIEIPLILLSTVTEEYIYAKK